MIGGISRVTEVVLQNLPELQFELSGAVGRLDQVTMFVTTGTGVSGTIPSELGALSQLQDLLLYNNPSLSGSIPSQLGQLSQLQVLYMTKNPSLSGSIPSKLGELSQLQELSLSSNPSLSGSIPSELGELSQLRVLDLTENPSLSGSIPSKLGELSQLQHLYLRSNPSLSGSIPTQLGELSQLQWQDLSINPLLSGSIPTELGKLSQLRVLDLSGNPAVSGSIPSLEACSTLQLLDVHNCSLIQLPASLPSSVTHVYMQHNPINAQAANLSALMRLLPELRVLDASFINSNVQLTQKTKSSVGFGPRVSNPSPCRVGASCAFVLHMYDDYDMPMTSGGLLQNLTVVGTGGERAMMRDNYDGTFTAAIPSKWIRHTGSHVFQFEHHGQEFRPMMDGPETVAVGSDCDPDNGGLCAGLRTVEYLPRDCPGGNHTQPDAETGASCRCRDGFEPDGNATNTGLSCHRSCHRAGEGVSRDGGSCVCTGNTYNSSEHGILLCSTGGWQVALESPSYQAAINARSREDECMSCPVECTRCEGGVPIIREGWRVNATTPVELTAQLQAGADGKPQFVFSCPYTTPDCPRIRLVSNRSSALSLCLGNHTGALCASCRDGFSRKGSTDNSCVPCANFAEYIENDFGLQPRWFVTVVCLMVSTLGCGIYFLFPQLKELHAESKANLRILLGSAQILTLLPEVLDLVFPPSTRAALSFVALFVADVRDVVRFDCWGWTWQQRWLANVFGVPLLAVSVVTVHFVWRWWRLLRIDKDSRAAAQTEARQSALRSLAFVAMFLYPQISSCIFSALRCRQLGAESSWLEADYSVSCLTPRYSHYRYIAYALVVVVPVGFPLALLLALVREWWKSRELWTRSDGGRDDAGDSDVDGETVTIEEYHFSRVHGLFGFALDDYNPACWWFEPIDLLRKLALTGLLQFVHRGTAAQCFCGSVLAFGSFGAQQYLCPYRNAESNVLKALVDTQLFLTFLISFILRVLPKINTFEPFGEQVYGWLLLCSMAALLVGATALLLRQLRRRGKFRAEMLVDANSLLFVSGRNRLGVWSVTSGAE